MLGSITSDVDLPAAARRGMILHRSTSALGGSCPALFTVGPAAETCLVVPVLPDTFGVGSFSMTLRCSEPGAGTGPPGQQTTGAGLTGAAAVAVVFVSESVSALAGALRYSKYSGRAFSKVLSHSSILDGHVRHVLPCGGLFLYPTFQILLLVLNKNLLDMNCIQYILRSLCS